jgi:hypothetical protein
MTAPMSRGTMPWAFKMGFDDGDGAEVGEKLRVVLELEFVNVGVVSNGPG